MVELQSKIDKKIVAELPKVSFPGRIFVIYTEAEARKAIDYLNTHVLVGVDTETRPSFRKGAVNKVALLQVSTYDTCFLFRLNHLGLPDFLEEFLQNNVLKIGLSLKDDFAMLRRRNQKDPRMGNWVELQDYVALRIEEKKSAENLCPPLSGKDFQEPAPVQLGGRHPDRGTAALCRHRCLGLRAHLSIPGRTSPFGQVPCDTYGSSPATPRRLIT